MAITDYLRGRAAASVPGIRLICKYVVASGSARTSQIQAALRPPELVPKADSEGSTLPASLAVAEDIGLLARDGGRDSAWSPGPRLAIESAPAILETGDAFRPLILGEISRRALELATGPESPSDLSLALTWALGRDPLIPLPWDFREAEGILKAEGMSAIIDNADQWRAFRRWLTALGPGTADYAPGGRRVLSISTASAIRDAGVCVQQPVPAREFVKSLLSSIPVFGHELLVKRLPPEAQRARQGAVSPCLAQGLLELEMMRELKMLPGDDSENMVRLAVGGESRTVRSIEWLRKERRYG
jgi:hypothetical protein